MKSLLNYSIALLLASSLFACGSHQNDNQEVTQNSQEVTGADCMLSFNPDSTKFTWTAYKTTNKVGVSGTFNTIQIEGVKEAATTAEVFENATFKIASASVSSNNPDRDKKLSEHFFGTMVGAMEISGSVVELGTGYAMVLIEMNGVKMKQKFDLKTDDATYCTLSTDLNLEDWDALKSVNALNEVCFDLHKGADGESKLWSEVRVEMTVQLNEDCP